jgi:ATPase family associated with various cellular activities (AAA)
VGTIDGPIALPHPALPFDELARLRDQTREIKKGAVLSLANYRDPESGGYFHILERDRKGDKPAHPSRASGATVICFLIRTGRWRESIPTGENPAAAAQRLIDEFVKDGPWESADLKPDNAFTVAFILEVVGELTKAEIGGALTDHQKAICQAKLQILVKALHDGSDGRGRISLAGEIANSYLTDLVTRVLDDWSRRNLVGRRNWITPGLATSIWLGAIQSVNEQMALLAAVKDASGETEPDVFELGYATVLAARWAGSQLNPERRALLREALAAFFAAQKSDGGWPRSRRLFNYPEYGDAYCYDFEFVARMIRAFSAPNPGTNIKSLVPYLPNLQRTITRLTHEAIELPRGGYGWSSRHHRAFLFPESWSTATGFDVAELVDRLVTDCVTTAIVDRLEQSNVAWDVSPTTKRFDDLLDSRVRWSTTSSPRLKAILRDRFLLPIHRQARELDEGKKLSDVTPVSAILYGPPGTSKTTYAKAMASFLGWQLITVDPSHLLRGGFDNIHLEINSLFRMLTYVERVVVFFDEIDELVRDRSEESAQAVTRFLTTSMLPRIVKLRDSRRMVFLVATNHIEVFDPAIARPGRFDLVLPVMPPTAAAKLAHWSDLRAAMKRNGFNSSRSKRAQLEQLTYDETDLVRPRLSNATDADAFAAVLAEAAAGALMNQAVMKNRETWLSLMKDEESRFRPGI